MLFHSLGRSSSSDRVVFANAKPRQPEELFAGGYFDIRMLHGQVCAIKRSNYTTALVVGIDRSEYERRYCFEYQADAQTALAAWDGQGHPSGPWIKCKGARIDLLNPEIR